MQMQDYVSFFQGLLVRYYQFTLDNAIYATCLAISVWLITAILYSFTIASLNRKIRQGLKARDEVQQALDAAREQAGQLQADLEAAGEQVQAESRRSAELTERLSELGAVIGESITALAADPELGQQGLTVAPGLQVEHLWQRYCAAVKHLGEDLLAARKASQQAQQNFNEQSAKLAETNLQLQATQTRFDLQKQQLGKLEQTIAELQGSLEQEQQSAKQRLAAAEARYQADLERLAVLEQKAVEWIDAKQHQQELQEKLKNQDAVIAQLQAGQNKQAATPPAKAAEAEPRQTATEAKPAVSLTAVPATEPAQAPLETSIEKLARAADEPQPQAAQGKTFGKFKSLFSGGKAKPETSPEIQTPAENAPQPAEPVPVYKTHFEPEEMLAMQKQAESSETAPEIAAKPASAGIGGKFKGLFGSVKTDAGEAKIEVKPVLEPAPVIETKPEKQPVKAGSGGKFMAAFANAKQNFEKLDAVLGLNAAKPPVEAPADQPIEPAAAVAEPLAEPVPQAGGGLGGKFKNLLGSSKQVEKAVDSSPATPEPVAEPETESGKGVGGLKNMLGKFKGKGK